MQGEMDRCKYCVEEEILKISFKFFKNLKNPYICKPKQMVLLSG